MTIEECKSSLGRLVTYIPFKNCDKSLLDTGIITSVNDEYAFVRYGNDINSKATKPEDLKL